ncbi:hypothetical protein [Leifsonia sp. Leaf264]|uniref:hypothetical protein n=1 Tax=Leifsonia sp. Leaf264 TaxID=1736314 RepID=UPI0006FEF5FE|nr:hypothetical protein [Leifsonia sp. Leaf264]KQP01895.1 hypothetical protein ASF30_04900 [Leifsonia sp. Leaf264]
MMTLTSKQQIRNDAAGTSRAWPTMWEWLARPMHYRAVRRFRLAAEHADAADLAALLDPGITVVVDSGETTPPTIRVVRGTDDAVALLRHGMRSRDGLVIVERSVNGQAGLVLSRDGTATAAMTVDFAGELISMVWIRLHPETQRHWNTV